MAYNRPSHLKRLLESLSRNQEANDSPLIISIDGPKTNKDRQKVAECRAIAEMEYGFKSVQVIAHDENRGLADSVITAVTNSFLEDDRLIILEDDLVVSKSFLQYMNKGLEKYAENKRVASLQGYQYPGIHLPGGPAFLRGADCWGWATWRDRWNLTNFDANLLLDGFNSEELIFDFDFGGTKPNLQMLKDQKDGKIDSWAIRWHASQFLQNRLSLFPEVSLVQNLGSDGSGTNAGENSIFHTNLTNQDIFILPDLVEESKAFRKQLNTCFSQIYIEEVVTSWKNRFFRRAKLFVNSIDSYQSKKRESS